MTRLRRLLKALGPQRIVVVTDRYPPDCLGGAELSLHVVLQGAASQSDLLVVTFTDAAQSRIERIQGVTVLRLSRSSCWNAGLRRRATVKSRPAPDTAAAADQALVGRAMATTKPRGGLVHDFISVPEDPLVRVLREVLIALKPAVVHADNYRALTLVACVMQSTPTTSRPLLVGLVRDNRFHCPRFDQSNAVDGAICAPFCAFECATRDAPEQPDLQREMLQRSQAFRLACLSRFDRVIVTSRYLQQALQPRLAAGRVVRVPNPADHVEAVAAFMRGEAELPGTNLLVVGMLNECKGQVQLLRRLPALVARVPDVRLHFAGRGERIARRLVEIATEQGLAERVVLHGFLERDRLYALYRACQIVVSPTVWAEPFGRVPLEAGLAMRPVIACAVGGLVESILDGETGILVPPGDLDMMLKAIQDLAQSPAARLAMGRSAYKHISVHFSVEETRSRLFEVWSSAPPR